MASPGAMVKARMFWRSLWLQATWSFEGMQAVGFADALEPVLDKCAAADQDKCRSLARQQELFNTHPFLSNAILGAVARAELEGRPEEGHELKQMLMGPFGGKGDSFFWGAVKPLAALVGVALGLEGIWWAPVAMVGLFLSVNLASRIVTLELGLRRGKMAAVAIQKAGLILWSRRIKLAVSLLLGWVLVRALTTGPLSAWGVPAAAGVGAAAALALVASWAVRRDVDPMWLVYGCLFSALLIGIYR